MHRKYQLAFSIIGIYIVQALQAVGLEFVGLLALAQGIFGRSEPGFDQFGTANPALIGSIKGMKAEFDFGFIGFGHIKKE